MTAPMDGARRRIHLDVDTAWYAVRLGDARYWNEDEIIGRLSNSLANAGFATQLADQTKAWRTQLALLKTTCDALVSNDPSSADWILALEYDIPRRGKRVDTIILIPNAVIVIEFKIGATAFARRDIWQIQDYALDLRDFHEGSLDFPIYPILVATQAPARADTDANSGVRLSNARTLPEMIKQLAVTVSAKSPIVIEPLGWLKSGYRPTPTIVEAARRVFAGHDVRELSHNYADNLGKTTEEIAKVIEYARSNGRRVICFVTGVPGSGKTLAGLTAMQDARALQIGEGGTAFMSGNVPLVRILREALIRDQRKKGRTVDQAKRETELLIQNVHRFIEEYGVRHVDSVPPEFVIAFDEAQRAWHSAKLSKRHTGIVRSEPELVLDIMSRPANWSVVVALVGGGQEIHDGEAGLEEWGHAINRSAAAWEVVISPEALGGGASVAGHRLFAEPIDRPSTVQTDPAMHLSVSVRSPKAQRIAEWVNAVISLDAQTAQTAVSSINGFRLVMTRSLNQARAWLEQFATGRLRAGLLASSGALRLRSYGLEIDAEFHRGFPIERWFLDDRDDFRASHSLEVAMTEFECQGLELDYVGLCWGNDLTLSEGNRSWNYLKLRGKKWLAIRDSIRKQYLLNKYRVLMTRAREGIVIWIPEGDSQDPTRTPEPLDRVASFLREAGVFDLDGDKF